uniref:(California timema) hypothetical protein n=1 Tax=Timema californicum TaxID=61474 RepID=A0A7R9P4F3_TIMCA|nr:unnamed protein product [Timema californicum]
MENQFRKTHLNGPNRDSKRYLPVIGSLIYCESSALDHAATKDGRELQSEYIKDWAPSALSLQHLSADTVNRDGEPLKFGQNFLLSPVETTTEKCLCGESTWEAQLLNGALPLYVQSEIPQIDTQLGPSGHASVRLSSVLNTYCRWRVLYWDPNMRLETEGCPFPPHCRVIVNHASSNKNLSVEPCHWFPSYFGMECQVSVHTYRDVHRRETSENMWMFITQKPTDAQVVKPSD